MIRCTDRVRLCPVKLLLICAVLLVACRKEEGPDRWPEVEKLATPTVPAADGTLLTTALERVKDDDVPEMALEDAIAWRRAGGGLPWRNGRTMEDPRMFKALKLGEALIERRGDNPEAIETARYLAQRMRAEAPALIDSMIGFSLAVKVTARAVPRAEYVVFAPTEAEALRAIPADALHFMKMVNGLPNDDKALGKVYRRAFSDMLVGAPTERVAYVKHLEAAAKKAEKDAALSLAISSKLPKLAEEMFSSVETFRAWAR